jgi:talin
MWFLCTRIISYRIISSAEDVMDRSLRLIEEARQALKSPDSPSNAQNLAHVAKDVSQVRQMDGRLP